MKPTLITTAIASLGLMANAAHAQTEITWWHGMGGHLGEVVNQIAEGFNESQDDYSLTPVFKGSYEETLTAAIAGYRVDHVDFGTLLDSQVAVQQYEIQMHHHHIDYEKTLASLEALVGVRLF